MSGMVPRCGLKVQKKKSPYNEILESAYFAEDRLPPLSPGHDARVPTVFRLARGEVPTPFFDR